MAELDSRTHDPNTFNAKDYAQACQLGTCDCAPLCQNCGKVKMWDEKRWLGHHDWHCGECHAYFTATWKEV